MSCMSVQAEMGAGRRERERAAGKLEPAGREREGPSHRPTRERRPGRKEEREREEGRDGTESEKRTADGNLGKETATGGLYDIGHSLPTFWACVDTGLSQ